MHFSLACTVSKVYNFYMEQQSEQGGCSTKEPEASTAQEFEWLRKYVPRTVRKETMNG